MAVIKSDVKTASILLVWRRTGRRSTTLRMQKTRSGTSEEYSGTTFFLLMYLRSKGS
jgi:hypothetical protein